MPYLKLVFAFLCLNFFACNSNGEGPEKSTSEKPKKEIQQAPSPSGAQLPSVTVEIMRKIFNESDYADFVFYNTNFSMSMDKKQSIQSTLRHIAESVPAINPSCKAIGRVFYQIEGENYIDADIFFEDNCKYYVFYVDGKKTYSNQMTPDGINHYNNIFSQLGNPQGQ